jgi:hypothetical protein
MDCSFCVNFSSFINSAFESVSYDSQAGRWVKSLIESLANVSISYEALYAVAQPCCIALFNSPGIGGRIGSASCLNAYIDVCSAR